MRPPRRGGRVAEGAPLLREYTSKGCRGFESPLLRHQLYKSPGVPRAFACLLFELLAIVGAGTVVVPAPPELVMDLSSREAAEKSGKSTGKVLTDKRGLTIIRRLNALVAQLDRVSGYEPEGRGFESLPAHHIKKPALIAGFLLP